MTRNSCLAPCHAPKLRRIRAAAATVYGSKPQARTCIAMRRAAVVYGVRTMRRSGLHRLRPLVALLIALTTSGCASSKARPMTGRGLVELDESWAATAASADLDAAMDFWSESAVLYMPDHPPLYGKKAIREYFDGRAPQPNDRPAWVPSCAGLDERGSMAYTLGEGVIILPDANGTARPLPGRYVAVWNREGSRWRCAVKCWTPSPPDREQRP